MFGFGRLFRKKPLVTVDDRVFGRLEDDGGGWTGKAGFDPRGWMICVEAPDAGPSELQRKLFEKIRAALPALEEGAVDYMRSQGIPDGDVSLYAIIVGTEEETSREEFVMELTDKDEIVIHRVTFARFEPVDYTFDD